MLKYTFILIFLFSFIFYKKKYWLVQNFIFIIIFIYILIRINTFYFNLSYFFGIDLLSYGLVLLSFWICGLMFLASESIFTKDIKVNWFIFIILFLLLILYFTFSSINLFLFYLFFERSLVPTFFLILGWGYQPERIQAGYYLYFYTLFASLPLLLGIFYCKNFLGSVNYLLFFMDFKLNILYFCLVFAFLVKIPMFFVHLWLPKAHVEAPVSGSIILAGVLLKLGGYGLLRVYILIQRIGIQLNLIWYTFSLIGGVLIRLVCLLQIDIKSLIAYSSVSHIGIIISGLITLRIWGFTGSYVLIIGHGLCSSGLFCLSNIVYERLGRRRMFIGKGLLNFIPSLSLWWFLLCSRNMAAPPSLNLLGEIILLNRIISWTWLRILSLRLLSFFRAAYSLYLFAYTQHGVLYSLNLSFSINYVREYMLLFLHWIPLNILILKSDYFSLWLYLSSLYKILICGVKEVVFNLRLLNFCQFVFCLFFF